MAKRVNGHTYCSRCRKEVAYHNYTPSLSGMTLMTQKVCNECGYVITKREDPWATERKHQRSEDDYNSGGV